MPNKEIELLKENIEKQRDWLNRVSALVMMAKEVDALFPDSLKAHSGQSGLYDNALYIVEVCVEGTHADKKSFYSDCTFSFYLDADVQIDDSLPLKLSIDLHFMERPPMGFEADQTVTIEYALNETDHDFEGRWHIRVNDGGQEHLPSLSEFLRFSELPGIAQIEVAQEQAFRAIRKIVEFARAKKEEAPEQPGV